jgi:E3 SUMO-protein ligase PIAS1
MIEFVLKAESTKKKDRFKQGQAMLLEQFSRNVVSLQVDVKCPITLTRMSYPVRGQYCTHLQTFELSSYIELNSVSKRWLCPVCGQSAYKLRRCFLTECLIKKLNEVLPLNIGKDIDNDNCMEFLMQEMNNFSDVPGPEEASDIDSVIIERDLFAVNIKD